MMRLASRDRRAIATASPSTGRLQANSPEREARSASGLRDLDSLSAACAPVTRVRRSTGTVLFTWGPSEVSETLGSGAVRRGLWAWTPASSVRWPQARRPDAQGRSPARAAGWRRRGGRTGATPKRRDGFGATCTTAAPASGPSDPGSTLESWLSHHGADGAREGPGSPRPGGRSAISRVGAWSMHVKREREAEGGP